MLVAWMDHSHQAYREDKKLAQSIVSNYLFRPLGGVQSPKQRSLLGYITTAMWFFFLSIVIASFKMCLWNNEVF